MDDFSNLLPKYTLALHGDHPVKINVFVIGLPHDLFSFFLTRHSHRSRRSGFVTSTTKCVSQSKIKHPTKFIMIQMSNANIETKTIDAFMFID